MPIPVDYTLMVDVSHWQSSINFHTWKDNGVDAVILKLSQGSTVKDAKRWEHYLGAKAAGMYVGGYHWADPTHDDAAQVNNCLAAIDGMELDFVAVDVEQYWASWVEYANKVIKTILPGERISENAYYMAEKLNHKTLRPVLLYTRATFIQDYAPQMLEWLDDWDIWWAQYVWDMADITLDWQALKAGYLPISIAPKFPTGWKGIKDWTAWQWTGDKFILPGCGNCLDLNYLKRDFLAQFKLPQAEQPDMTDQQVTVTANVLNMRTEPMGTIIGSTSMGKELVVEQTISHLGNPWHKVTAYVSGAYTKPK